MDMTASNILLPGISTRVPPSHEAILPMRFGTPIEKNVALTEDKLKAIEQKLKEKLLSIQHILTSGQMKFWCQRTLLSVLCFISGL